MEIVWRKEDAQGGCFLCHCMLLSTFSTTYSLILSSHFLFSLFGTIPKAKLKTRTLFSITLYTPCAARPVNLVAAAPSRLPEYHSPPTPAAALATSPVSPLNTFASTCAKGSQAFIISSTVLVCAPSSISMLLALRCML